MTRHLTPDAAKELGKTLRFIRYAREATLRDVAAGSGLSPQYVQNIERAERLSASEESLFRLAKGYGIDRQIMADLLLKARVMSALERHGWGEADRDFIWRGIESRAREVGQPVQADIERIVAAVVARGTVDAGTPTPRK